MPVLAVDLDGTLTHTDTLHEAVIQLLRHNPLYLFALVAWWLKGKAFLKHQLSQRVKIDVEHLPYNTKLLDWLHKERSQGRHLVLCTATHEDVANAVSAHLGVFDRVIASNATTNMSRSNKRHALDEAYGSGNWIYAGNSSDDLAVWQGASEAIVVNASTSVKKKATGLAPIHKTFEGPKTSCKDWVKVVRAHQWLKNLLLLVPLIAAHETENLIAWSTLLVAFLSFSLCASVVYIINDLFDLNSDRRHPRKCSRPFASGTVPIVQGVVLAPVLVIASLALGYWTSTVFLAWLLLYFALTSAYSFVLKKYALLDCLTLAALYTLRILAGAAAIAIPVSFWLLAFSVFVFLSLAFIKRYAELYVQQQLGNTHAHGRGYETSDASLIQTLGVASGYASVLVLAFYLQSESVQALYAQPELIWFAVPLMLYWVSYVWLKAHRGEMHDDPIVFATKDTTSLVVAGLLSLCFMLATLGVSI